MDNKQRRAYYERHGLLTRQPLGFVLPDAAACWPLREMLSYKGVRYTYQDIWRWSMLAAHHLVQNGIKPGDRVLVQSANSVDLLILQFAIWRVGGICVPVLPIYRQHEVRSILADTKPVAIAANLEFRRRALWGEIDELCAELKLTPRLKLIIESDHDEPGWQRATQQPASDSLISEQGLPEELSPEACAVILYTSGSTAAPKGAMLASDGILSQARSLARLYGVSQTHDVVLCASPLAHTAALTYGILLPMMVGTRTVLMPGWNADDAIKLIDTEKATIMSAPVLFLQDLVEHYEATPQFKNRLRLYNSGGGTPPSLVHRADALGIKATRNYGMTEISGGCTLSSPDDALELRANFDGRPIFGAEVQIVDDQRREVPAGETGEIRIRSPQLMLGYTDPKLTAEQVDAEGWFYSGDLGRLNDAGYLAVTGRLKDIINRGGEKLSAHDIEDALTTHPDVSEAAVVGAPDARFGEVVAAFVKLRPNASWHGPDSVLAHLEARKLAKQKFPAQWYVVEELPRTATGKVQKQALRDRLTLSSTAG